MRFVRARVGRVASFLHFLYELSGHDSTVSRCATGSNRRNPQSQRCGPRGARTRTVWNDARSAAGKGKKVLGRSRWDCGLRRCDARRLGQRHPQSQRLCKRRELERPVEHGGRAFEGNLNERAVFDRERWLFRKLG
jgi:hypothetical protein